MVNQRYGGIQVGVQLAYKESRPEGKRQQASQQVNVFIITLFQKVKKNKIKCITCVK